MKKNKMKVLQINLSYEFGGVSSLIYNLFLHIDRELVSFDFLSPYKSSYKMYEKEISKMNGHLYSFDIKWTSIFNKLKFCFRLKKLLKSHSYDIVHINSGSFFFNLIVAIAVRFSCHSKIVIHCHSIINKSKIKRILTVIFKPLMSIIGDYYLSCSNMAGKYMFTNKIISSSKYSVLPNGIDIDLYKFDNEIRKKIRNQFNIPKDAQVIGNVGRFVPLKNHDFIVDLFNLFHKKNPNSYLMLVGDGTLKSSIENKVKELNISDYVIFTGLVKDVYSYMNAMDIFLLPSESEGFGLVAIEAQANGLDTLVSTGVPVDTKVTDLIQYSKLNLDDWLKIINNMNNNYSRESYNNFIKNTKYSIRKSSDMLLNIYKKIVNNDL